MPPRARCTPCQRCPASQPSSTASRWPPKRWCPEVHVQVLNPLSRPQRGEIGVRVGRVLIYVANREALASFVEAWTQAAARRSRRSVLTCRHRPASRAAPANTLPVTRTGPSGSGLFHLGKDNPIQGHIYRRRKPDGTWSRWH
jgi:hypothetical protein